MSYQFLKYSTMLLDLIFTGLNQYSHSYSAVSLVQYFRSCKPSFSTENDFLQIAPNHLLRACALLHNVCPMGYGWGYGMGMGMYRPWRPYGMWGGYGMGMGMPWGMGMYGK
ncbi:hypothetical protein ANCCEY_08936 [Ancylostoma ceylanicum]|uniref:Uncharacterized protein n=1 Tax=Ancylostoma ceylanicum TaxID=53326 RepID=A0A0D6LIV2_9BILA|nr:hypothetical protein ANCCEY_08936 [Ancylostoma ceylanicum]